MATLSKDRVRDVVCQVVGQYLQIDEKQVDTSKSFAELDIDSIDAIEMQMAIEGILEANLFDGPMHDVELKELTLDRFIDKIVALKNSSEKK